MNVWLLIGAPGSGKTTYGINLATSTKSIRLCPDEFRAKFGRGEWDQSVSKQAFEATRQSMDSALKQGNSVIIDATNMYKKSRKQFLDIAASYNAETTAIVFEATKDTLIERNINRGRQGGRNVPVDVIERMLSNYERPDESEFDKVVFISRIDAYEKTAAAITNQH